MNENQQCNNAFAHVIILSGVAMLVTVIILVI